MMYKVLVDFADMQDGNYIYRAGATYPRLGLKPSKARIDELLTAKNRRKTPMIEEVKEKAEPKAAEVPEPMPKRKATAKAKK